MQYSYLLAIAAIHATILSIIAAAIGITVSLVGSKRLDVLGDVFKDRNEIEAMFPLGPTRLVPWKEPHFNTDDAHVRARVVSDIVRAAYGSPCNTPNTIPEPCVSQAELGEKAFLGLLSLVHHYPFSSKFAPNQVEPGSVVRWQSAADHKKWYEEIMSVLLTMEAVDTTSDLLEKIEAYQVPGELVISREREAYADDRRQYLRNIEKELLSLEGTKKAEKLAEFRLQKRLLKEWETTRPPIYKNEALQIFATFDKAQRQLESFISFRVLERFERMNSPGLRTIILLSSIFTFVLGVLLPMIHPLLPQCSQTWIPYTMYVMIPLLGHVLSAFCAYQIMNRI
jgi:hypothetical protein